jgi:predicted Fe-Mo cluster-binding NifX family protein
VRIAITVANDNGLDSIVLPHFGSAPFFVLADMVDGTVENVKVIPNPFQLNHQPGQVPEFLQQNGANVILSGGMGRRAMAFFDSFGIEVATGASGSAREALSAYLQGDLRGAEPCAHSDHDDHENHHHGHEHRRGHSHSQIRLEQNPGHHH